MVPPVSHRVSRVPWYSGSRPLRTDFRLPGSHRLWRAFPGPSANRSSFFDGPQPQRINPLVWPLPRSLATTSGISVDFSSSPYLDVSVQAVPDISGSTVICTSPKLFAACHVLHRLLMPRHSPCALSSLTLLSVCTERSRSGSQAFELCRLRVLRNCLCYPSKSSTNHFCFPLLLALHTWLLCSVFKVRFSGFFRNQIQTLNRLNA